MSDSSDEKSHSLNLSITNGFLRDTYTVQDKRRSSSLNDLPVDPEEDMSILSHSDSSRCDSLEINDEQLRSGSRPTGNVRRSNSTVDSLECVVKKTMTSTNVSHSSDAGTVDSLEQDVGIEHCTSLTVSEDKSSKPDTGINGRNVRRIQRSNTFDSFNENSKAIPKLNDMHGYDQLNKSSSNATRSITPNRAHVFMTSNECVVVPGTRLPKENKSSKLRFEKQHSAHDCVQEVYLTPMQRKDNLIKSLRREIHELNTKLDEKDREIALYKQTVDSETSVLVAGKDEEIDALRDAVRALKESNEDLNSFCEESLSAAAALESRVNDLKESMADREQQHEKLYLEMYKKGQNSAHFERAEELEELAGSGGCKVTISELVKKLAWTEVELAKWQTLRREEIYHDALRPETEADATFRFLRDSFFHYLCDARDSDQHLRAMIRICHFTEPQMKKIESGKVMLNLKKSRSKRK